MQSTKIIFVRMLAAIMLLSCTACSSLTPRFSFKQGQIILASMVLIIQALFQITAE